MAEQVVVLADVDSGVFVESQQLSRENGPALAGSQDWRIASRRMRGGKSEGVDVVEVDNGALCIEVLPTRGMGLWRGFFRGHTLGWQSPVERPVHPTFVDLTARNGLGWLEGFNELLCRCGLAWYGPPVEDEGWPLTLHGRIANLPAHHVSVRVDDTDAGLLEVRGIVDETGLFGPALRLDSTLTTAAGSNRIDIHDVVTNLSDQPGEIQLLYHTNIGRPFLEEGARVVVAADEIAPRDPRAAEGIDDWTTYAAATPGFAEQVYFAKCRSDASGCSAALLANAAGNLGFLVEFDTASLPCLSVWKNTGGEADGYVTGLEPSTGFPNTRPFEREQGRLPVLQPGELREFHVSLTILDSEEQVEEAANEIGATAPENPVVHRSPQPSFSAG